MQKNEMLKKTPLYEYYQEQGIKLVDFGGWAMPIQFSSIIQEHQTVREKVGLFDCSHMGEIIITGNGAEAYLNNLLTNDVSTMENNSVQYNILCNEKGGAVDDGMLYRYHPEKFMLVCNASNREKVWGWMEKHLTDDAQITDLSDQTGLIAVQGPLAETVLGKMTSADVKKIAHHCFQKSETVGGVPDVLISRTGYTGEDGFELYTNSENIRTLWEALMSACQEVGGLPCGLGARDTLRLEAGLPLYGHELSEEISPLTAGLGFAVKLKKASSFIGKEALQRQKDTGLTEKIVGFVALERGIPRQGYSVYSKEGDEIGVVTSGTMSPILHQGIGFALIESTQTKIGNKVKIEIRNKYIESEIVNKTFYKK